jgi:hypothetical protein
MKVNLKKLFHCYNKITHLKVLNTYEKSCLNSKIKLKDTSLVLSSFVKSFSDKINKEEQKKIIELKNYFRASSKNTTIKVNEGEKYLSTEFINKQLFGLNNSDQNNFELKKILIEKIRKSGPISISDYMSICLFHPQYGYYSTKEHIFGDKGDFVTAPEISQIFGEMITVFLVKQLEIFSFPKYYEILEIGPGRGYLAIDIIRSLSFIGKLDGLTYSLIDKSDKLREIQKEMIFNFCVKNKYNVEIKNLMPAEHSFINVRYL